MNSSIHRGSDVQLFIRNEDGTQTMLGDMQSIRVSTEVERPEPTPEERVMQEVEEHLQEALAPYVGLEVQSVEENIRDTAATEIQSFVARRAEDIDDSFAAHRNDDEVDGMTIRGAGGTLEINNGGIRVSALRADQLRVDRSVLGGTISSIGAHTQPPRFKVLPETVENTMDMIALFRAMLEARPLILDQGVVEQYNLHKYVKELENPVWTTI